MKRLNNKGYMLVEIIVASVIAFSVAYYLINLTYKFKDKNEDVYYSTVMLSDKVNITKNIMNDLKKYNINSVSQTTNDTTKVITFNVSISRNGSEETVTKILSVEKSKVEYGKFEDNNFVHDKSYYKKDISKGSEITGVDVITEEEGYYFIVIKVSSLYTNDNEDIKLLINKHAKTLDGDYSGYSVALYFNTKTSSNVFSNSPSNSIMVKSNGELVSDLVVPVWDGHTFDGYYLFNDDDNKFLDKESSAEVDLSSKLSYSTAYSFDEDTGGYCLSNISYSNSYFSSNKANIIDARMYTCGSGNEKLLEDKSTVCCSNNFLYQVIDVVSGNVAQVSKHESEANMSSTKVINSSGVVINSDNLKNNYNLVAKWN